MTGTFTLRLLLSASLLFSLLIGTPVFSIENAPAVTSDSMLLQTFVANGAICFDEDDTEYKNVLIAVRNKWLLEKNAAFRDYSLLASYWLGMHLLTKGSQEEAFRVFDELYVRTRNSASDGERAYALGAFLAKHRAKHAAAKFNAEAVIAEIKSEFGKDAGKLSFLLKEIDIFQLDFLKNVDDAIVQSLIPTSVPRYFSKDTVPVAMVNSYDQEIAHLFGTDPDRIVHELYVLKLAGIAKHAWEMNNDVPRTIMLAEKFINEQKGSDSWRVKMESINLVITYASVTCGGEPSLKFVQKAKMFLNELKEQLPKYHGKFLAFAESLYSFGQQTCARIGPYSE